MGKRSKVHFYQGATDKAWPNRYTKTGHKKKFNSDWDYYQSRNCPVVIVKPTGQQDLINQGGGDECSGSLKTVIIYTDGACVCNPGPGGYGVVLLQNGPGRRRKELSGGYSGTKNNRMEILAVIKGLEALKKPCRVKVFSDSTYVVNGISLGWAKRWQAKNWVMSKPSKLRPNADLWEKILELCEQHEVNINWVKGHSGDKENERADYLAGTAARMTGLPADLGYLK